MFREKIFCTGLFLALLAAAAEAQTLTATLAKSGKEKSKTITAPTAKPDGFPVLRREGNRPSDCLQATRTTCLPTDCDIDYGRTYSTNETRPFYLTRGFGKGGAGYGVVMNSVISADGGSASHHLNAASKCLTSTIRVCSKRFVTGASYEGYHEIYGKCATLQPWEKKQTFSGLVVGSAYSAPLATWDPPAGSANGISGTATTEKYSYTIDSTNPPGLQLVAGMFAQNPNTSGTNGPQFWAKVTSSNDLSVTALEVTQGIQDLANRMPLVGRRQTAVRAYIKSQTNVGGVKGRLRGFRANGTELPGSPLLAETEIQGQTTGGKRLTLNDAFLFRLPAEWTESNVLVLRFELDPGQVVDVNGANNVLERLVHFAPPVEVHLASVPLHLHPNGAPTNPLRPISTPTRPSGRSRGASCGSIPSRRGATGTATSRSRSRWGTTSSSGSGT
jgi:hypothetical protein